MVCFHLNITACHMCNAKHSQAVSVTKHHDRSGNLSVVCSYGQSTGTWLKDDEAEYMTLVGDNTD